VLLTEPDMRARIRLFGLIDQNASESWVDTCGPRRCRGLSSSCSSLYAAGSRAARMRPRIWPSRPPKGCRRTRGSIVVVPSFSIHLSLCSTGFHRLHCSYEEIRLLHGHRPVVVASFRSTARADPRRSPWVRTLDVPQPPLPLPPRPRLDFGHRVRRHAHPADPACSGVHSRSVPRFASGFFPTPPRGASRLPSHDVAPLRAVASGSRLLPTRPAKDLHLQSSAHARHTSAPAPAAPSVFASLFCMTT
jgi:hypothetical protein